MDLFKTAHFDKNPYLNLIVFDKIPLFDVFAEFSLIFDTFR